MVDHESGETVDASCAFNDMEKCQLSREILIQNISFFSVTNWFSTGNHHNAFVHHLVFLLVNCFACWLLDDFSLFCRVLSVRSMLYVLYISVFLAATLVSCVVFLLFAFLY